MRFRLLLSAVALVCVCSAPGAGFERREWVLLDDDAEYLRTVIPLAAQEGLTGVQLSHAICMSAADALVEPRLSLIREAAALAKAQGLSVSVWAHELEADVVAGGPVRLDEELAARLAEKYARLFDAIPDLDGVVLTLAETHTRVMGEGVSSDLTPAERVAWLVRAVAAGCGARELTVRTFAHTRPEIEAIVDGLRLLAQNPPPGLRVMSKDTPHDFHFFYPHNPALGAVGGLPQTVEVDLGCEYWGSGALLCAMPDYLAWRMRHALGRGCTGAAARISRGDRHAHGTPNECNIYVFDRLSGDVDADPRALLREWLAASYGEESADALLPVFLRSFEACALTFYALGEWMNDHSQLPSYSYAYALLPTHSRWRFTGDPIDRVRWEALLHPSLATVEEVRAQKHRAEELCRQSLLEVKALAEAMPGGAYRDLVRRLEEAADTARAFGVADALIVAARLVREAEAAGEEKIALGGRRLLAALVGEAHYLWKDLSARHGEDMWPAAPRVLRYLTREKPVREAMRFWPPAPSASAVPVRAEEVLRSPARWLESGEAIHLDAIEHAWYVRRWEGREDCSVTMRLGWCREGLLLVARVVDDVQRPGDALEVAASPRGEPFGEPAVALSLSPTGGAPRILLGETSPEATVLAEEGGYLYVLLLPWSALAGFTPSSGAELRLCVLARDDDRLGADGWVEWTPGLGDYYDTASFGKVVLGDLDTGGGGL